MLVLKRRLYESIMIGQSIKIQIVSIKGSSVQLGITANRHIPIYRTKVANNNGRFLASEGKKHVIQQR